MMKGYVQRVSKEPLDRRRSTEKELPDSYMMTFKIGD
jgi:hypothetical protein